MIGGTKEITVLPPNGHTFAKNLLFFSIEIDDNSSDADIIEMIKNHPSNSYKTNLEMRVVKSSAMPNTYFISLPPSVPPSYKQDLNVDDRLAALRADDAL
jgi:hypothetical protein